MICVVINKYSFIFSIKIIKMKNKILKLVVVLVIAVMAVFNWGLVSKSSDLSDASLANVEALAQEATNPPDPNKYTRTPKYTYYPSTGILKTTGYCCYAGGYLTSCTPSNC
jgi:hypothetical protein